MARSIPSQIPESPSAIELPNFRFCYTGGAVKYSFVTPKTMVATNKLLGIPKLELQAVALSARLSFVVMKEHDYITDSTYF